MWVVSAPCKVGRDEHPGPRGGPEVTHNAAPRCRLGGLGMDIHVDMDFIPLYTFKVLLWHGHVPQCQHHTQSGFSGQCFPLHPVQSLR